MIPRRRECWDLEEATRLWHDAQAVVREFVPTPAETAAAFDSRSFEARVTSDDVRLLRLAEDARELAAVGRETASYYEAFADGIERRRGPRLPSENVNSLTTFCKPRVRETAGSCPTP